MSTNVYPVNGNTIHKVHRKIPYDELLKVLREDGSVFLKHPDGNKFKRQTVHRASRVLTDKLGKKVGYSEAVMRTEGGDIEGFILEVRKE